MSTPAKQLFYKITQIRSTIGMPPKVRKTVESLGLKHRYDVVFQTITEGTAVRLGKVKELIKVELVEDKLTRQQVNLSRKYKSGFEVSKSA